MGWVRAFVYGGAGETGSMEGLVVPGRGGAFNILTARMRLEHKRHALVTTSSSGLTEKQVDELEGWKPRRHMSWIGGGLESAFTGPKPKVGGAACPPRAPRANLNLESAMTRRAAL